MLSSLPLQILLFFHAIYDAIYTVALTATFIWKGTYFPLPNVTRTYFALEVALVYVLFLLELARLFIGSRGNKLEQVTPLLIFLILSAPACLAYVYFLHLQIYVTRADQVFSAVAIVFLGLEVILALLAMYSFIRASKSQIAR